MNYLSVCSGIEAATVAWHHIGWKPVGFSEIEKFPSNLLAHHYPSVTNYGDMTKFKEWNINDSVELLVGGTPCQSFSVAGLRKGLADPRGNLMLTYLAMADHFKPKWLLWENVPGVLSSNRGADFGALLQGMAQLGYGFAYRVLDAQHFGVPQRRRRVFVVGCLGDWRSAAKVLFESESLCGDITPRRSEGEKVAPTITRGFGDRGYDLDQIAGGGYQIRAYREADLHNYKQTEVAGTSKASGGVLGGGSETFLTQPSAYNITFCDANGTRKDRLNGGLYVNETDTSNTLTRAGVGTNVVQAVGVGEKPYTAHCLRSGASRADKHESTTYIVPNMRVRRLTPKECERLQGFPDNYTNIPNAPDTGRYKALGNSMAVPVMRWIGERINGVNYEFI